jgi:hypothetical protein
MLTACVSTAKLGPPPADLSSECTVPDLSAGQALIINLSNQRLHLKKCASKYHRFLNYYESLR